MFHCISLHLNSRRRDHLEVIKKGSDICSHPHRKRKAALRKLQGGKGRVHRGPIVGSRPGAPCRRTQPGSASLTHWGATSKQQQRGKRGCAQSERADEKLQKSISKTSFHGRGPSRGLPARAPHRGAQWAERGAHPAAATRDGRTPRGPQRIQTGLAPRIPCPACALWVLRSED